MEISSKSAESAKLDGGCDRKVTGIPYIPGLDGLRAMAVLAVIAYHSEFESITGGFLGVEVFFVISGYLITALLLDEYDSNNTIDLRKFWIRRARRLLPALLVYVCGAVALAYALADDVIPSKGELLSTLGYVYNWFGIFQEISYTEVFERKNFFHHLWSLAVEEQFYLVWPVILLVFQKYLNKRLTITLVVIGIVASSLMMWVLYEPFEDPLRVYYGTDTRAAALLIGVLLAYLWRPWRAKSAKLFSEIAEKGYLFVGLIALALLFWANTHYTLLMPSSDELFRGGFLITSLVTAGVIASIVTPNSYLNSFLGITPLVWIGKRSYGLYLWHWPVFQLTRERVDVDLTGWELFGVRMFITLVLVEISYQYIERPIREQRMMAEIRKPFENKDLKIAVLKASLPIVALVASFMVLQGVQADRNLQKYEAAPTTESHNESDASEMDTEKSTIEIESKAIPEPQSSPTPIEAMPPNDSELSVETDIETPTSTLSTSNSASFSIVDIRETIIGSPDIWRDLENIVTYTVPIYFDRITFIGDSVMLGALTDIGNDGVEEAFLQDISTIAEQVTVSAAKNRQWYELRGVIRDLRSEGEIGEIVVIHLGNNGVIDESIISESLDMLSEVRRILLVNVRVPRRWESKVNNLLDDAVETFENAELVDWYTISNSNPEYFTRDGVHTIPSGAKHYVNAIITSLGGESVIEEVAS